MHPAGQTALKSALERLAVEAKTDRKKWRSYWSLAEAFHQIKLAYAITAHRSQGSTYLGTFVQAKDILLNPNREEANRCLYVACTRFKKQLFLLGK